MVYIIDATVLTGYPGAIVYLLELSISPGYPRRHGLTCLTFRLHFMSEHMNNFHVLSGVNIFPSRMPHAQSRPIRQTQICR